MTGASGFVGRALVRRAVSEQVGQVRGSVRRASVSLPSDVEPVLCSPLGPETDWTVALHGMDVVVHTAARVHMMREHDGDPLTHFRYVNTAGTLRLARQAAALGARRFIFISTIGVNGAETFQRPFTADDVPMPHSNYAISKLEAEQGLRAIAEATGMEVTIIRPPLVIGPDAPGNFRLLLRILHRRIPLPLGAIHNLRSFVGLENLVDLILTCVTHPRAANETFLVADGYDVSTATLVRRLGLAMEVPAHLIPVPESLVRWTLGLLGRRGWAQQLCGSLQVDMQKTKTTLDWWPRVAFDEELQRAANAFRRGRGANSATAEYRDA